MAQCDFLTDTLAINMVFDTILIPESPRQSRGLVFVNRSTRLILEPPKGGFCGYLSLYSRRQQQRKK
jgi:hypothetical protein